MQENPPPYDDAKPKGKPPYLFLIPVALGLIGFIGYQTVRMGAAPEPTHYKFALDTSTAVPLHNATIVVHANRPSVRVAQSQPKNRASATPTPEPTSTPTPGPSETPAPNPTPTSLPTKVSIAKPAHHAHHPRAEEYEIAREPVPHIDRSLPARTITTVNVSHDSSQPVPTSTDATTPPITDAPSIRKEAPATAAPVTVAEVQHQAPAQAPPPINASDRVVDAKMTYAASPDYPDIARDQGIRGTSVVFVTVDPNGSIVHVSIATSSGNAVLDHSAVSAARSSRYVPPKIDGKPATETYRVTYDFAP